MRAAAAILLWMCVMAGAFLFHIRIRDARVKKRWHPRLVAAVCSSILLLAWIFRIPVGAWVLVVSAAAILGWISLGAVGFCDSCGATLYRYLVLGRMNYCAVCGARLEGGGDAPPAP